MWQGLELTSSSYNPLTLYYVNQKIFFVEVESGNHNFLEWVWCNIRCSIGSDHNYLHWYFCFVFLMHFFRGSLWSTSQYQCISFPFTIITLDILLNIKLGYWSSTLMVLTTLLLFGTTSPFLWLFWLLQVCTRSSLVLFLFIGHPLWWYWLHFSCFTLPSHASE